MRKMSKVRVIVQFSGGKDSQASLIHTVNKYGADKVEAVFCDTGWEHPCTVEHVHKVAEQCGVKLHVLAVEGGFQAMCKKSFIFPTANRRICTARLKLMPMVDWLLQQDENFILIQGIRKAESASRAKMEAECSYFREYFEPNAKGLYRKKAVLEWCKTHDASLFRPIFDWSAQQVITYILENGQEPNPLYRKGASRVGCFPCIMARLAEVRIVAKDPEMRQRLIDLENEVNALKQETDRGLERYSSFFTKGTIPDRFCRKVGGGIPTAEEVLNYVTREDATPDMFEPEGGYSCMSLYHGLCE